MRNQAITCPYPSSAPVPDKFKSFSAKCLQEKQASICKKKKKKTNCHTQESHLPCKWTVASSSKHEARRQQGVVTSPRPLVQSARLLPARLRTAEWRMEGWTGRGSGRGTGGEGGDYESQANREMSRWKVKLGWMGVGEKKPRKHATLRDLLLKSSTTAAFPLMEVWLTRAENGRALVSHWRLLRDNAGF